jgi:hypothetical protein
VAHVGGPVLQDNASKQHEQQDNHNTTTPVNPTVYRTALQSAPNGIQTADVTYDMVHEQYHPLPQPGTSSQSPHQQDC